MTRLETSGCDGFHFLKKKVFILATLFGTLKFCTSAFETSIFCGENYYTVLCCHVVA